jgi:hypothetical protein
MKIRCKLPLIAVMLCTFLSATNTQICQQKIMTRYVLIPGFASKATDGGIGVCKEMVRGFQEPVKILICLFARPEAGWTSKF